METPANNAASAARPWRESVGTVVTGVVVMLPEIT